MFGLFYRRLLMGLMLVVLLAAPLIAAAVGDPELLALFTLILIWAMAAAGLDFLAGYAGMVSLCQGAFVALGAWITAAAAQAKAEQAVLDIGPFALTGTDNAFIIWPAAALAGAGAALLVGLFAVRLTGVAFLLATVVVAAFAQDRFGVAMPEPIALPGPTSLMGIFNLGDRAVFYYICLGALLATLFVFHRLAHCGYGLVLRAGREDERRLRALGHGLRRHRLPAFVLAGAVGGLAGAFLVNAAANADGVLDPSIGHWLRSAELLAMVFVGGAGTLIGAVIGAGVVTGLSAALAEVPGGTLAFGAAIMAVVLLLPRGLYGSVRGRIGDG